MTRGNFNSSVRGFGAKQKKKTVLEGIAGAFSKKATVMGRGGAERERKTRSGKSVRLESRNSRKRDLGESGGGFKKKQTRENARRRQPNRRK